MKDGNKTKAQLIDELKELRNKISKLEKDCKEQQLTENVLQRRGGPYKILVENSTDNIYLLDKSDTILYLNLSAARNLGVKPKQALGESIFNLFPAKMARWFSENLKTVFSSKGPISSESKIVIRGNESWMNLALKPVLGNNHKIIAVMGVTQDITDQKLAKEELLQERDRAQGYLDIAGVMFIALNARGEVTLTNRRGSEILGYNQEEIIGKNWFDTFLPKNKKDEIKAVFNKLIAGEIEPVEYYENHVLTKSGEERFIAWHNTTLKNKNGDYIGTLSSGEDITERKRILVELEKEKGFLSTVLDNIANGVVACDPHGVLTMFNRATQEFHGLPQKSISADHWADYYDLYQADGKTPMSKKDIPLFRALDGEKVSEVEMVIAPKKGKARTLLASGQAFFDKEGNKQGAVVSMNDVTERKLAEEALKENEAKFRGIFESNMLGTLFWDDIGEISDANDAFLEIVGYTRADLESGKLNWGAMTPSEYDEIDKEKLQELAKTGIIVPYEKEYIHKNGSRIPIVLSAAKLSGAKTNGVAIILDITERKRMEEELAKKNKELEQIIYVTSHDLRSPLVNMLGFSKELSHSLTELTCNFQIGDVSKDVLEKVSPILKKDIPESMQYIQSSVAKMDGLLKGLLFLSRMGRIKITIDELNMNKLMANVIDSIEYKIKEQGVKLEVANLIPCIGDETQINQVFTNLLDNALKYLDSERPGIIKLTCKRQNTISLYCVEDNGIGISSDHQDKIFEIFHRLNPEQNIGEGLGLTIVRRILDRHNGKIWVKSEPGMGSKFYVSLPSRER